MPSNLDALKNKDTQETAPVKATHQHYNSARSSVRLITKDGGKIAFAGFKFITNDPDIITYLNDEIAKGLPGITKGELLTSDESDPMVALKARIIKEHEEQKAKAAADIALGVTKDMGTSKAPGAPAINPVSSKQVAR